MIEMFSLADAHRFQDAMASQARLRHRVFIQDRGLPHLSYDGLEFDEFDTPAALYLVWRDRERVVRGLIRLLRTDRPYMLETCWPHLADAGAPKSPHVWEATRVCVDRTVQPQLRRTILPELLCAVGELFEKIGAAGMVGVTRQHLLTHFIRDGVRWLGPADEVEGEIERAFFVESKSVRPVHHCARYGIRGPVLLTSESVEKVAA